MKQMPVRLSITVSKIASLPNTTNAALISEFYQYMKNNGASESHTNNSLKTNMAFAKFLGRDLTFYDVKTKEQIIAFLDTKIKTVQEDLSPVAIREHISSLLAIGSKGESTIHLESVPTKVKLLLFKE